MGRVPVTFSDSEGISITSHQNRSSPMENNLLFQACIITKFRENSNIANIILSSGKIVEDVRIITPTKLMLMFLGPVSTLANVPGVLFFRFTPEDGFVIVGDIGAYEYGEESNKAIKPFYL